MISTMESYFRGERELFQGLAIDRLEPEEWIKYPVLRLVFTRGGYNNPDDLPKFLGKMVDAWEKEYDTSHPDQTLYRPTPITSTAGKYSSQCFGIQ